VLLCGRYEGIDQRFIDTHVTHQISLGDFVLSGGELAAMVLLDALRLQPGVLNDEGSFQQDSFNPALDGCWTARTTPGPSSGMGRRCRPRCCPATMPRSSAGAATSACASRPSTGRS
jgi:hypothetical protein